ncbi:hypothetical protein [Bernardetia sp.]|uniref:hypothetical protein n=1 Tax=Bernardetia sp. TaxID=1937974 RepID=UPI0025C16683|nr:hypothetical protein [Bernardetia sp.]
MFSIKKFDFKEDKKNWNTFIETNSEGHFFFETDYLFYHKERFDDFSLMFFDRKNELVCVLPACVEVMGSSVETTTMAKLSKLLYSHKGLTFGGFIFKDDLSFIVRQKCVFAALKFLKENNFEKLILKPLPSYFNNNETIHRILNDKKINSQTVRVEANSVIELSTNTISKYSKRKQRNLQKAKKASLQVEKINYSTDFWHIIEHNLKTRYHISPVHSATEIQFLKDIFPQNIHFFVVKNSTQIMACSVAFIYQTTIHLQYMAATNEGKKVNALDFLIDEIIKNYPNYFNKNSFDYLSLGVSENRDEKETINEGLFKWKEEFGAKVCSHFVYQINLAYSLK